MAEQEQKITDLELWLPSDSFQLTSNRVAYEQAMAEFATLTALRKAGSTAIFCAGNSSVIYHTVTREDVLKREERLKRQKDEVTSALRKGENVESFEFYEEGRVRELHLGLGRTALFLAASAEGPDEFMEATHDLKRLFSMLEQPIHTLDELSKTSIHQTGLMYLFVKAARKHKTLTFAEATELAEAIDGAVLPYRIRKGRDKISVNWGENSGPNFIERISFASKKQERKTKPKEPVKEKSYWVHFEEPKRPNRPPLEPKTQADVFIHKLTQDKRKVSYSEKLDTAHKTLLVDGGSELQVRNDNRIEMTKLAVEAYIEAMSKHSHMALDILGYVSKNRANTRNPLSGLIVIGNLFAAKAHGSNSELPGLSYNGIPKGFRALREVLRGNDGKKETDDIKKLGEIVEAYLNAAFSDEAEPQYEIPKAPKGIVSAADFAIMHDVERSILESALPRLGIDALKYNFGKYVRIGLTPEDQIKLLPELPALREQSMIEPAPKGTLSVSGFAIINRVSKATVERLIEKHGIETGIHRFRTRAAASLDPEAQEKLKIYLPERKRRRF